MIQALQPFISVILAGLAALSASRMALSAWKFEHLLATPDWYRVFVNGLRVDMATLACVVLLPFLLINLAGLTTLFRNGAIKLSQLLLIAGFVVLAFFEFITPSFIHEYTLRPNHLFLDYLKYPEELAAMLWGGYKLEIVLILSAVLISARLIQKYVHRHVNDRLFARWYIHIVVLVIFTPVLLLAGRATLAHRPMNPAMVAFAPDPLVNQLALNSAYNVAFAISAKTNEKGSSALYSALDPQDVIATVRSQIKKPEDWDATSHGTWHALDPVHRGPKRNIVILLQESLGARFVGKLSGSQTYTPELDRLMDQGWNFTRFFATGTRSIRGIEAVTTGFPPSPAQAVVKLPDAQKGFFSIFSHVAQYGYHTQFLYGGEAHFDNMKAFFYGNGVKEVIDLPRFDRKTFVGSWGASDEDLYNQAHLEFEKNAAANRPFASLVFTSTNHTPFEFPDGRISVSGEKQTRENAIRYSDWALGRFFEKAKASAYWKNTIFIVVADHDARIYENDSLPIKSFHIPALILGHGIEPRQDPQLAGSLDVVPTLLSLAGIGGEIPTIGRDLNRLAGYAKPRAMMQFEENFGYLKDGTLIVLAPEKPAISYRVDMNNLTLTKEPADPGLAKEALAHVLWAEMAYKRKLYSPLPGVGRDSIRERF